MTMNGHVDGWGASPNRSRSPCFPTADEALQYTPFTSIVPFSSDVIPIPAAYPPPSSAVHLNDDDRKAGRTLLRSLNKEADSAHPASTQVQQHLNHLQKLLKQDPPTEYHFKRQPGLRQISKDQEVNGTAAQSNGVHKSSAQLGAFTKMALRTTKVPWRYPTPESPERKATQQGPIPSPALSISSAPSVPARASPQVTNESVLQQNVGYAVPAHLTPRMSPAASVSSAAPAVMIPSLPVQAQRTEYESFPEVDARIEASGGSLSKKREREEYGNDGRAIALNIDQREKADAAVQVLFDELENVFEAENAVQAAEFGDIPLAAAHYFSLESIEDMNLPVFVSHEQDKLESIIQKALSAGRIQSVPLEMLVRVQKLFGNVVACGNITGLSVGSDWTDSDVEEWSQRIASVQHGLQASRTLLRIMSGCSEEKQLQAEGLVKSVLDLLRHVLDTCVIPVVEARSTGPASDSFPTYLARRKDLTLLVRALSRVLKALGDFLSKVDVDDSVVTVVEALTQDLVFAENASNEKDSIVGIKPFEDLRRAAMDVVSRTFAAYPAQRSVIITDILSSLGKLPVSRQNARQFKMADNKPIQLVSALLMQLVQTSVSASSTPVQKKKRASRSDGNEDSLGSGDEESEDDEPLRTQLQDAAIEEGDDDADIDVETAIGGLRRTAHPRYESALANTQTVVHYLVHRGMTATKTGDQPYRNLLDIFTEDFINVLGSPEWPAADFLLQVLFHSLFAILKNNSSSAQAQNMALDLMGLLGSGIFNLEDRIRSAQRGLDVSQSEVASSLAVITDEVLDESVNDLDAFSFDGPLRIALEYLQSKGFEDAQSRSAKEFQIIQWAESVLTAYDRAQITSARNLSEFKSLAMNLRKMSRDPQWLGAEYAFEPVSSQYAHLASALRSRSLPFCRYSKQIMNTLLSSLTSESASLKNRGLKSVTQLLESNPSLLDSKDSLVLHTFLRCLSDTSSLVRDSALNLIGKSLSLRPSMDRSIYNRLIYRSTDNAPSVRKRCIKLLKDIYLRNEEQEMRSAIAEALLQRMTDIEDSVSELSRQTFEEVWFTPYTSHTSTQEPSAQKKVAFESHVALVVKTAQRGNTASLALEPMVNSLLSSKSRNSDAIFHVCKEMVASMVDAVIENSTDSGRPSPAEYLQTLAVFAKARPKLFCAKQLEVMRPYIENLQTNDDRSVFRAVLVIYRRVFPYLQSMQHDFLRVVHTILLESVSKIGRTDLDEAAPCLWTIAGVIKNTAKLGRMTSSVLQQLHISRNDDLGIGLGNGQQNKVALKVSRLLNIAGAFFPVCDFDNENGLFKERFPQWDGKSVATLVIDVIRPFAASKQPPVIRDLALDTICCISRSWPKQYLRRDISNIIEGVFRDGDRRLQHTCLSGIKGLFAEEERRSESGAEIAVGEGVVHGAERLGKSLQANDNDGVATTIAQQFLHFILRFALTSQDELATTAAEVVASVNRQGLVHPKETGVTLVALETSPINMIATIAFQEHRNLNQKHESVFDKEYMKAVYEAFLYQKNVVNDPRGATLQPHSPKLRLTFEVLKQGNGKARKKFLANIVSRINFDISKLDVSGDLPLHLQFARFCVENLAFFDYSRIDEILHLVDCMEKTVATTGTGIAHAIETEVQNVQLGPQPMEGGPYLQNGIAPVANLINDQRLRQLTAGSMVLSLMWETRTFIRRLWGLQKQREGKNKTTIRDLNRAPTKAQGVSGDRYWDKTSEIMTSLNSREAMLLQCKAFAELLSIDNEVKVPSDDEEADLAKAAAGWETPSDGENSNGSAPPSSNRGRKRKSSMSMLATPSKTKKRGRPSLNKRKSGGNDFIDEDADWD